MRSCAPLALGRAAASRAAAPEAYAAAKEVPDWVLKPPFRSLVRTPSPGAAMSTPPPEAASEPSAPLRVADVTVSSAGESIDAG